jgi:hypothetical protein
VCSVSEGSFCWYWWSYWPSLFITKSCANPRHIGDRPGWVVR